MKETKLTNNKTGQSRPGVTTLGIPQIAFCDLHQLPDSNLLTAWSDMLSESDKNRLINYKHARRKREFVVGRTVLRHFLQSKVHSQTTVHSGEQGRPFATTRNRTTINCSISHSDNWLVAAFSTLGPVGVDIECPKPSRKPAAAARWLLSDDDISLMHEEASSNIDVLFYQTWCAREATVKCLGSGHIFDKDLLRRDDARRLFRDQRHLMLESGKRNQEAYLDVRWGNSQQPLGEIRDRKAPRALLHSAKVSKTGHWIFDAIHSETIGQPET